MSVFVPRSQAEPLLREAALIAEADGATPIELAALLHHLGTACAALGKLEDARGFLERAEQLAESAAPDNSWATTSALAGVVRRQGRLDEAFVLYRKLSERSTVWLVDLASIAVDQGRVAEAVTICHEALQRDGDTWEPVIGASRLVAIGRVLERCGRIDLSLELAQRAVDRARSVVTGEARSPSARSPRHVLAELEANLERVRCLT